ncbi:MAG TPA: preprotein translocase subunit SecE [Anaerolineae bacterium]|nr:preprotein translocase subunit SecE [Anaerolineae bacterium]
MAKAAKKVARKENRIIRYLRETRSELRKVVWPTRREATNLTIIVLAVMVAMSALLGLLDFVFTRLFGLVIR